MAPTGSYLPTARALLLALRDAHVIDGAAAEQVVDDCNATLALLRDHLDLKTTGVEGTDLVVVGDQSPHVIPCQDINLHEKIALRAYLTGDDERRVLDETPVEHLSYELARFEPDPAHARLIWAAIDLALLEGNQNLAAYLATRVGGVRLPPPAKPTS
jgi:hypothetical protein